MRRMVSFGPALVVLCTAVLGVVLVPALVRSASFARTEARIELARQVLGDDDILQRLDRAISAVADAVAPSVVHIDVAARSERPGGATGSGWVYDLDGHIITNAHVIRDANLIRVQFHDGRIRQARLVAFDPFTDIAVLRVGERDGLFPAPRATGEIPRQGQSVFAFGSPFGFKFSMSRGIISGLGREPSSAIDFGGYTNFIQTDAAVNPGNSGGPLVNSGGRVIGMNVAIATGKDSDGTIEGQSAGISFAIPLATIESVVEQLIERGTVSRGFLGINLPNSAVIIDDAAFRGTGIPVPRVVQDGPAALGGLRSGDVIVSIDGEPVPTVAALRSIVSNVRPGAVLDLSVFREGAVEPVEVVAGEFTFEELAAQSVRGALLVLGLDLSDGVGVPRVRSVDRWWASTAGFKPGQTIRAVDGETVSSLDQFFVTLANRGFLAGEPVEFTVESEEGEEKLELRLPR